MIRAQVFLAEAARSHPNVFFETIEFDVATMDELQALLEERNTISCTVLTTHRQENGETLVSGWQKEVIATDQITRVRQSNWKFVEVERSVGVCNDIKIDDTASVISALKAMFRVKSDTELASALYLDKRSISAWRSRGGVPQKYLSILGLA